MIDKIFEHDRIELLLTRQIDQNAWIEIAAARAHNHPAGRGQAHAGVDGLAALDRGDAGAVAKMGNYQTVGQIAPQLAHDRFAGEAMKTVALDALLPQSLGKRKNTGDIGQAGVKGCVEAGDLRKAWKMLLRSANDR